MQFVIIFLLFTDGNENFEKIYTYIYNKWKTINYD